MLLRLAKWALLLLIAALPLMKSPFYVGGSYAITATDALFVVTAGLFASALWRRQTHLRWDRFYLFPLAYFAALAISALFSPDLARSMTKLATQGYLAALAVLAFNLIDDRRDLVRALIAWCAGAAIPAFLGLGAVVLFFLGVDRALLDMPLHQFGTLAPGHYPRIETTFGFPSMMVNYLTVALLVLLALRHERMIPALPAGLLLVAICVTAFFGLTPGLGGFAFAIGAWIYLTAEQAPIRYAALGLGAIVAVAQVPIASVTPILHPTASYLVHIPGFDAPFAPAVRLLCWTAATKVFLAHPLLGAGYGSTFLWVPYVDPSGILHNQQDAHNTFLNIAAQAGLVGLAAMTALIAAVIRRTGPWRLDRANTLKLALGIAWLDAFAIQGLTGSYEDARHLWVLLGLWLAALSHERQGASSARSGGA